MPKRTAIILRPVQAIHVLSGLSLTNGTVLRSTQVRRIQVILTILGRETPVELCWIEFPDRLVTNGLSRTSSLVVASRGACENQTQTYSNRTYPQKKVVNFIKLQILKVGKPTPPMGPALGAARVNIMQFCQAFGTTAQDRL